MICEMLWISFRSLSSTTSRIGRHEKSNLLFSKSIWCKECVFDYRKCRVSSRSGTTYDWDRMNKFRDHNFARGYHEVIEGSTINNARQKLFVQSFSRSSTSVESSTKETGSSASTDDELANVEESKQFKCSLLHVSSTSLGLADYFVINDESVLGSIRQLPEVKEVLYGTNGLEMTAAKSTAALERSVEIFNSLDPGGKEHKATLALLAESYLQRNDAAACIRTVQQLQGYCQDTDSYITALAQAKAYWLVGDFKSVLTICLHLLRQETQLQKSMVKVSNTARYAFICAKSGTGMARLLSVQTADDLFSVRDPFRVTVVALERRSSDVMPRSERYKHTMALGAAYLNMGVAEAVYALKIASERSYKLHQDVPLTLAVKSFRKGLSKLEEFDLAAKTLSQTQSPSDPEYALLLLKARLYTNMSWTYLQMVRSYTSSGDTYDYGSFTSDKDKEKLLKSASEYARQALHIYNNDGDTTNTSTTTNSQSEGLPRTLTVIAECYQRSDAAVTAEGLYQSAIEGGDYLTNDNLANSSSTSAPIKITKTMNPCFIIELCDAYRLYSTLCSSWEKRESYAKQLLDKSDRIEKQALPPPWQGKSSIHGSLWFWTVSKSSLGLTTLDETLANKLLGAR